MGLFKKKEPKVEPNYAPEVEPSYKIGDKIWTMYDNKPHEKVIVAIAWDSVKKAYRYYVLLEFDKDTIERLRSGSSWSYQPLATELFKSKALLLEHLAKE